MDPHSTPTTIYETEEAERARGWVPAFLTALLTTGGLWALQYFSDTAPFSTWADKNADASPSIVATLFGGHLTYFGFDNGDLWGSQLIHTAIVTATVFVVAYVVSWLGTIGIWPRAWWPVLLGSWFAATMGAACGLVAGQLELYFRHGHTDLALAHIDDVIATGGAYGLIWGLPIAFLVSLLWLAVPGRSDQAPDEAGEMSFFGGPSQRPGGLQTTAAGPAPAGSAPAAPLASAPPTPGGPTRPTPTLPALSAGRATAPSPQPVRVRTFTTPQRANGAADDTAAWKAFVRDVRRPS